MNFFYVAITDVNFLTQYFGKLGNKIWGSNSTKKAETYNNTMKKQVENSQQLT
jgi:hypothetical protein